MPVFFLSAIRLVGTVSLVQIGGTSEGGMRAMGTGMMVVFALLGLLFFAALTECVILEFLWIKVWGQRLRNERRTATTVGGRIA